jgi:hypothetical protein
MEQVKTAVKAVVGHIVDARAHVNILRLACCGYVNMTSRVSSRVSVGLIVSVLQPLVPQAELLIIIDHCGSHACESE